ncbi:MAG TPA: potassium-transporting ATPase subunit KdpB [Alphaproteobacteria bacterium]|nr:potassium-transporting ATPase subunit KdpB [Alphaproteobacteria bacterium]
MDGKARLRKRRARRGALLDSALIGEAALNAIGKLDPRQLIRNPVMFTVGVAGFAATVIACEQGLHDAAFAFSLQIALWLWFTVLFANFAEALAEGRGKAQADSMRRTKTETMAKKLATKDGEDFKLVPAAQLRAGDLVLAETGDTIPGDGDVVKGIATVDESAITGESAPVIRESGGDRSAVTGGTRVVSDRVVIEIRVNPGESFLDRMIGLVEGAKRQKTPNEIALNILLIGLTLIFLIVCVTLQGMAAYSGKMVPVIDLIALFVTLIPTTIGGLLSAIGIAGMDRLVAFNVVAKSGRAVEAAGDIDVLLLDKTGTITLGNRMASEFLPVAGASEENLAEAAMLSSLTDETPEGKSIVRLAEERFGWKAATRSTPDMEFIPFSATTRMSGVDAGGIAIRKGAPDAILKLTGQQPGAAINRAIERVAKTGGTPLLVARNKQLLGVVHLKDIIKAGIRERFATLRRMGIRTVMITGDNALTAAAIAAEAGVDDFLAEASPEKKLELIRHEQADGKLIAMCGDGSNDAPALAQADVGVAMNTGTMAAREAGNMIDLDSNPTKLIEVVMIGKQLLMSRGALTTFSIANDVAKYFAIIPALFLGIYPALGALNVMRLGSPQSAVLSAIIFNALILIALVPLALKGVKYRPASASAILRRNLLLYGGGGLILPFIAIKAIDMIVSHFMGS